ncbi:hypothetical protein [Chryseobacterium sp. G0201]|uniref:hypothetical protein n=1 Tax=Chryseobacterium sp. G0201 TaxID=2487065 RepID=UPI000F4E607F|nr:hypothetical protein [Chryseobacterium sp. G0201]AZA52913.1 hypothetical protein EG348_07770 [Chryseobacterium sp. G0201]
MKIEFKELFDEIINWKVNNVRPKIYLKKAKDELSTDDFYFAVSWLLTWLKQTKIGLKSLEKYELGHKKTYQKYNLLFQHCPLMTEIFELHPDVLTWNPLLIQSDILEIRDYIDSNYKPLVRTRNSK